MRKKYRFTGEIKVFRARRVQRIVAAIDFGDIKKGDVGGFVESEDNLSHFGNCWISNEAAACDKSMVYGDAVMSMNSLAVGNSVIRGRSVISGNSVVEGSCVIDAMANVLEDACVGGVAVVSGKASVKGRGKVYGASRVTDDAVIGGDAYVSGSAIIGGDAVVLSREDYFHIVGGEHPMTFTRSNNMLAIGCERRTLDDWWEITYTQKAERYPATTKLFRFIFSLNKPRQ